MTTSSTSASKRHSLCNAPASEQQNNGPEKVEKKTRARVDLTEGSSRLQLPHDGKSTQGIKRIGTCNTTLQRDARTPVTSLRDA
jgi:hypothetical protein